MRSILGGTAPTRDPLVGTQVGDYLIQGFVGSGAMGIVYRASHEIIGKTVAIKVLKPEISDDPEMVARLVREARTVNAIRHPGIVDVFGFGNLPSGQPYIVMDLLEGEPLDHWIRREAPMSLRRAMTVMDELTSALGAAHEVGVVHRDLKPGNVFLEKTHEGPPRVKLLDFGLARQADRAQGSIRPTNPGTLLGTPAFMAPEQVMGQKVSPATDLYALGGILYQMLSGRLPHEGPSAVEVLTAKMLNDVPPLTQFAPSVSLEVEQLVMSLLHREADQRPQSAVEVRKRLKALASSKAGTSGIRKDLPSTAPAKPSRSWHDAKTVLAEPTNNAPDLTPPLSSPAAPRNESATVIGLEVDPALRAQAAQKVAGPSKVEQRPFGPPTQVPRPLPPEAVKTSVLPKKPAAVEVPVQAPDDSYDVPGPRPSAPLPERLYVPKSKAPFVVVGVLTLVVLAVGLWLAFGK